MYSLDPAFEPPSEVAQPGRILAEVVAVAPAGPLWLAALVVVASAEAFLIAQKEGAIGAGWLAVPLVAWLVLLGLLARAARPKRGQSPRDASFARGRRLEVSATHLTIRTKAGDATSLPLEQLSSTSVRRQARRLTLVFADGTTVERRLVGPSVERTAFCDALASALRAASDSTRSRGQSSSSRVVSSSGVEGWRQ